MNQERDKYLTEAMEECWHEYNTPVFPAYQPMEQRHCNKCGYPENVYSLPPDFSTWAGFGKLWEWAQKQKWWFRFWYHTTAFDHAGNEVAFPRDAPVIHPDRFADAVYAYLKEKQE